MVVLGLGSNQASLHPHVYSARMPLESRLQVRRSRRNTEAAPPFYGQRAGSGLRAGSGPVRSRLRFSFLFRVTGLLERPSGTESAPAELGQRAQQQPGAGGDAGSALKFVSLSAFPTHLYLHFKKKRKRLPVFDRSPEWARKSEDGSRPGGRACVSTPGTCDSGFFHLLHWAGTPLKACIRWFSQGLLPVGCVLSK